MPGATIRVPDHCIKLDFVRKDDYMEDGAVWHLSLHPQVVEWCQAHLRRVPKAYQQDHDGEGNRLGEQELWVHILDDADLMAWKLKWSTP